MTSAGDAGVQECRLIFKSSGLLVKAETHRPVLQKVRRVASGGSESRPSTDVRFLFFCLPLWSLCSLAEPQSLTWHWPAASSVPGSSILKTLRCPLHSSPFEVLTSSSAAAARGTAITVQWCRIWFLENVYPSCEKLWPSAGQLHISDDLPHAKGATVCERKYKSELFISPVDSREFSSVTICIMSTSVLCGFLQPVI